MTILPFKRPIRISYMIEGVPKVKTFDNEADALAFVKWFVNKPKHAQDQCWLNGIYYNKYVPAKLDYKETHIIKMLQ